MRSAGRRPSVFLPAGEWIWHWHSTCWMSGTHEEDRKATADGDEVEAWPVDSSRTAPQATRRPAPTCCTLNGAPTAPTWQPGTRGGADLDCRAAARQEAASARALPSSWPPPLLLLSFSSSSGGAGAGRGGAGAGRGGAGAGARAVAAAALARACGVCGVCGPAGPAGLNPPFAECPRSGTRQTIFFIFLILFLVPPGLALGKEGFCKKKSLPSAPYLVLGKYFLIF